jgi:hypothetical protein
MNKTPETLTAMELATPKQPQVDKAPSTKRANGDAQPMFDGPGTRQGPQVEQPK